MNLYEEIRKKQNGARARAIMGLVLDDNSKLDELMGYFFSEDLRLCQSSSWCVGMIAEKETELLKPYLPKMIASLNNPKHDAVIRNTVRAWQFMDIPELYEGDIFEKCFNYIANPQCAIAIRVFSMTVCFNIGKKYPELLDELADQLELCQQEDGKGILSRSKNVLKEIKRITIN